jgi:uncharacterized membrane protein
VTNLVITLVAIVAIGPLSYLGLRLGRKYRRAGFAAASLLLLFGLNFTVDPPPPQRLEAVEHEEEEAKDDEPK